MREERFKMERPGLVEERTGSCDQRTKSEHREIYLSGRTIHCHVWNIPHSGADPGQERCDQED